MTHELAVALSNGGAGQIRGLTREAPPILRDSAVVARASLGERPGELEQLIQSAAAGANALAPVTRELGGLRRQRGADVRGDRAARRRPRGPSSRWRTTRCNARPRRSRRSTRSCPSSTATRTSQSPRWRSCRPRCAAPRRCSGQGIALSRPDALPALLRTLTPTLQRLPTLARRQQPLFAFVGSGVAVHRRQGDADPEQDGPRRRPVDRAARHGSICCTGSRTPRAPSRTSMATARTCATRADCPSRPSRPASSPAPGRSSAWRRRRCWACARSGTARRRRRFIPRPTAARRRSRRSRPRRAHRRRWRKLDPATLRTPKVRRLLSRIANGGSR